MNYHQLFQRSKKSAATPRRARLQAVKTSYTSNEVAVPDDFLKTTRSDAEPISVQRIDFSSSPLPEYDGCYAVVLENVLSPSECAQLLRLAEASSPTGGWGPAMLNVGAGHEVLATDVRFHDRIVWDHDEIVRRIWDRCLKADGIAEDLSTIVDKPFVTGVGAAEIGIKWRMTKVNERMRFLRYGPGQYFKAHCDGAYETPDGEQRTFYTIQLYLNDSVKSGGELKGGATTFFSDDESRRIDVVPKIGRVLIFQHRKLYHSGDDVTQGMKYTMRSDLLYEMF
ncbi:hypothetical protein FIBSPDRAFT_800030 [Athelia psychrophila]|uniref:Prolyl 4-hydroxylase alpha subunit domain-containing protein n=1 Tax=Athelia psychrophila TaxID=1759441 RepID=A0A166AKM3_9AGAM|nr:hypothetical protein FIBSPDRAFT_800030 [Fibularhizoctonia sp. CBS 109695]